MAQDATRHGRALARLHSLEEKARWPKARKDPDLTRINDLRARLQKQCSGYFATADELAVEVLAALRVHESTRLAQQLEAIDVMLKAQVLGPSYMLNIKDKLRLLSEVQFVELQMGPTPWWNTRLYLVAALAHEFGRTRGFGFVDSDGKFLLMASPSEICHRLALRWPALEQAYAKFRREVAAVGKMEDAFAALVRDHRLEGLVDRDLLAQRVAQAALL